PAAKPDNPAAGVADGKHDAVAEAVVEALFIRVVNQHATFNEKMLILDRGSQGFQQIIPARWCKPDAIFFGDLAIQTPALEVIDGHLLARVLAQLLLVEGAGLLHQAVDTAFFFLALRLGFALHLPRYLNAH